MTEQMTFPQSPVELLFGSSQTGTALPDPIRF